MIQEASVLAQSARHAFPLMKSSAAAASWKRNVAKDRLDNELFLRHFPAGFPRLRQHVKQQDCSHRPTTRVPASTTASPTEPCHDNVT